MRYKPKSVAALQVALGRLPDSMRVRVDPGLELKAKTVGELRRAAEWPENLVVTTPQEVSPDAIVSVSHASHATRVSPKS